MSTILSTLLASLVVVAFPLLINIFVVASSPEKLSLEECPICADGSSPTLPNSSIPISSTVKLSCATDLPTNAIASAYEQGLSNLEYQCAVSQLWAYEHCGCPTPPPKDVLGRECWICKDGDTNYNAETWVPTSSSGSTPEGSCRFQALMGGLIYNTFGRGSELPELKCQYLTWGMDTWCGCPAETVSLPECTLCGDYTTSTNKCKRNPLAPILHHKSHHQSSSLGINFGTCQYYDWVVERLNAGQCAIYDTDSSTRTQFDGFDVKGFCCNDINNNEATSTETTLDSGVTLCGVGAATAEGSTTLVGDKYIPQLQATCREVNEAAPYLNNETVLVEPLDSLLLSTSKDTVVSPFSLRELCCNEEAAESENTAAAAGVVVEGRNTRCVPIPRTEYDRSSSAAAGSTAAALKVIISGPVWSIIMMDMIFFSFLIL